MDYFDYNH